VISAAEKYLNMDFGQSRLTLYVCMTIDEDSEDSASGSSPPPTAIARRSKFEDEEDDSDVGFSMSR